jgi:hypothetical protein
VLRLISTYVKSVEKCKSVHQYSRCQTKDLLKSMVVDIYPISIKPLTCDVSVSFMIIVKP